MGNSNVFAVEPLLRAAADSRGLALDAVDAANSGHLGMPLGCAEIGAALFGQLLKFSADAPMWMNRDRFVLSAGHGSIFLYTWLHLAGYGISIDDIKNFRKTGSAACGHPEFNGSIGVECTTGPLGQGIANAVGMAVACKKRAAMFNTEKHKLFDGAVVCLCGDGCMQEGIASEACSLAGHWQLDNLILILDSNGVTLDAELPMSQSEDVARKFEACGFEVFTADGNNLENFIGAFNGARQSKSPRPRLIIAKTVIGLGIDEIAGSNKAHGAAGTKFLAAAKRRLGLSEIKFFISDGTKKFFAERKAECFRKYGEWMEIFSEWQRENPDLARLLAEHGDRGNGKISQILSALPKSDREKMSTRAAAGEILQTIAKNDEFHVTGSADLSSSTGNYIKDGGNFSPENPMGRNVYFGVREHAMAAIANGLSYDGMFRPSCSTFLVFSDYMRAAMRMAALAKLGTIFILTHDSIAVGEDGPTHQPVEMIASLRSMPNLDVVRPADYEETIGAWILAMENANRPTALILSRQDLPLIAEIDANLKRSGVPMGAYVARREIGQLERIIISSGSELHLACSAAALSTGTRAVSMPCMEAFERQSAEYKDSILPQSCVKRIAIEAGSLMPWYKYATTVVGVENFGFSGQSADLMDRHGITLKNLEKFIHGVQ
jgi:transketolase